MREMSSPCWILPFSGTLTDCSPLEEHCKGVRGTGRRFCRPAEGRGTRHGYLVLRRAKYESRIQIIHAMPCIELVILVG